MTRIKTLEISQINLRARGGVAPALGIKLLPNAPACGERPHTSALSGRYRALLQHAQAWKIPGVGLALAHQPDKDPFAMKLRLTVLVLCLLAAASASASNDRRECKEELRKLKEAFSTNYTSQNHHGYRQAKASRDNEEYRKCASQARKARERVERAQDA